LKRLPSTSIRRPGSSEPELLDVAWLRFGLAIGVAGAATVLGPPLGVVLGLVAETLWPSEARSTVQVFTTVLAFDLAWWWFATAGQRWMTQHRAETP
jgi:hypothetical protein